MEQNLKQIEHLLSLFDQRDKLRTESNKNIAMCLNDTLLVALQQLFGIPDEALIWEDLEVIDSVLVLHISIEYDPVAELTPFMSLINSGFSDEVGSKVTRSIQLGIPLGTVFQSIDEIKDWFMEMAASAIESEAAHVHVPQASFDPTSLTDQQVTQLMYFQQQTKGIKQ